MSFTVALLLNYSTSSSCSQGITRRPRNPPGRQIRFVFRQPNFLRSSLCPVGAESRWHERDEWRKKRAKFLTVLFASWRLCVRQGNCVAHFLSTLRGSYRIARAAPLLFDQPELTLFGSKGNLGSNPSNWLPPTKENPSRFRRKLLKD